jgi:hypothetical protein
MSQILAILPGQYHILRAHFRKLQSTPLAQNLGGPAELSYEHNACLRIFIGQVVLIL